MMMRNDFAKFILLSALLLFGSGSTSDSQHWAERSLRSAVKAGVHRALEERVHFPVQVRSEIESIIAGRLSDHLLTQIQQFNAIVQGSFDIAEEFVKSAVKDSSTRTRWPTVQIIHYLETSVSEAEQRIAQLRPSTGLFAPVDSNNQISEVNLEQIIADVVSNLMTDQSFLSLINWLATLPGTIHMIADEFLANKTFQEIFDMVSSKSDRVVQGMVQGLVVDDVEPVEPKKDNSAKHAANTQSALGLVEAGLREAESILKLVAKTYRQIIDKHVEDLKKEVADLYEKMPYIPEEVMEYIKTSAIEMLKLK